MKYKYLLIVAVLCWIVLGYSAENSARRAGGKHKTEPAEKGKIDSVINSIDAVPNLNDEADFYALPMACLPTDHSLTIKLCPRIDMNVKIKYGISETDLNRQTDVIKISADSVVEIELTGLEPDNSYYYMLEYVTETAEPNTLPVQCFSTAKSVGNSFSFAVMADPHLDKNSNPELYIQTLKTIRADNNDFVVDLGDNFMIDKLNPADTKNIERRFLLLRSYYDLLCGSVPLYLVQGNHDGEQGWVFNHNKHSEIAETALEMRLKYFPAFKSADFYSVNAEKTAQGDYIGNYYSWEWGSALFVVIDPYRYTINKPHNNDSWNWTIGDKQYEWLRSVLEDSQAQYKFVFAHQLVGGDKDGRGGAEMAGYYEMGGCDSEGRNVFAEKRPGWELPIHQLMVKNEVDIYFHGHDHFFAKQDLDGLVYQLVPQPSHEEKRKGKQQNTPEYTYKDGVFFTESGYLQVILSEAAAVVKYLLPDGSVKYSYELD